MDFILLLGDRLSNNFEHLLQLPFFEVLFLLVVAWTAGVIFKIFKLPLIIGQLLAGLIIGPSLLNLVQLTPTIDILGQLGAFFIMLYLGVTTDPRKLLKRAKASFSIAVLGTLVPFGLGYLVMRWFGLSVQTALFMGMAISTTSLATKAAVLDELKILHSKAGNTMIGTAVVDNVLSLILFSVIITTVKIGTFSIWTLLATVVEVTLFFGVVLFVGIKIYPWLKKFFSNRKAKGFTFALIVALLMGALAELIGLHYILGAYLAGLFIREEIVVKGLYEKIKDRLMVLSYGFLAPMFFISLAFSVDFRIFLQEFWLLLVLILVAFVGKTVAAGGAALWNGFSRKDALIIGFGMNGRGAIELIIAALGLSMGLINTAMVSILVFVSFITTLATPIFLNFVLKQHPDIEYE
ncbi:cation:proton antiporter [bacterium]|nr:cation:proton antiporter [bacterium]MBT3581745.1 cation:proton antiporter [bacterium]MBT4551363.1 cation:proton antiporter [bacterium]MBT5988200.1 cation:proton antiporter [bacterium]